MSAALWIAGLLLLLLAGVGWLAGRALFKRLLAARHQPAGQLPTPSAEAADSFQGLFTEAWPCPATDVFISARDELRLHAYLLNADASGNRWVIMAHGWYGNGREMAHFATHFVQMGFSVLCPDARGHGASEGDYVGLGWHERLDIADWAKYLAERQPGCSILLFGVSMGASTVLMASGEALPQEVKAVISDSAYRSIRAECKSAARSFKVPIFPLFYCLDGVTRLSAHYSLVRDGNTEKQVAASHLPTLFIHGKADVFVPYPMLEPLVAAHKAPHRVLSVPGASHCMACVVQPEKYWQTVEKFLQDYFV